MAEMTFILIQQKHHPKRRHAKIHQMLGNVKDWQSIASTVRDRLKQNNIIDAKQQIELGLKELPNHSELLCIATEVCRAANDHERALEYAELLIVHHPDKWLGYGLATEELLTLQRPAEAKTKVHAGLERFPNEAYFLTIANRTYRESGDRQKSLAFANLLTKYHPELTSGYILSAQDSVALQCFEEAQNTIQAGLERIPNNVDLLEVAIDISRTSNDHEKAIQYAELLITHHTDQWKGYAFAAEDLIALKRFDVARDTIQSGLQISKNKRLLAIKESLDNDSINLKILRGNHINSDYFSSIEPRSPANKENTSKSKFCILLRCKHYQNKIVQDLANSISESINDANIWFVHDSSVENISQNVISVQKFRKSMGIDWSIIDRKGWLFGDFCYYAAINAGLSFDNYYLIEEDVRFSGKALSLLLEDTLTQSTDFICANFAKAHQNWQWLQNYSYSHPNENPEYECFFPISRASHTAIKFLFARRIAEFKFFADNHRFSVIEAKKYFSNDEAFTCNSIANSTSYTIRPIKESLIKSYFGLNEFSDISEISGDHIVHKFKL